VTQNIDNYHTKLIQNSEILGKEMKHKKEGSKGYGHTDGILEIHGNHLFMRCSNEIGNCSSENNFYDFPELPSDEEIALD
jgi:NAD-dependent SIR2 family protein deacetylase